MDVPPDWTKPHQEWKHCLQALRESGGRTKVHEEAKTYTLHRGTGAPHTPAFAGGRGPQWGLRALGGWQSALRGDAAWGGCRAGRQHCWAGGCSGSCRSRRGACTAQGPRTQSGGQREATWGAATPRPHRPWLCSGLGLGASGPVLSPGVCCRAPACAGARSWDSRGRGAGDGGGESGRRGPREAGPPHGEGGQLKGRKAVALDLGGFPPPRQSCTGARHWVPAWGSHCIGTPLQTPQVFEGGAGGGTPTPG